MQKNGSFVKLPCFHLVLKLSKKFIFCNSVLPLASNLKSVESIYYMHPKRLVMHFQEMLFIYYKLWLTGLEALEFEPEEFLIFNCQYLMNVCSEPYKQYPFLKECNENFQMQYANCFKKCRFLAEFSTKLQKMCFFMQFKDHNSSWKHENQRNDLIFLSTFSALNVCNIHFDN